ncbi:helix-turn-helix transcriptional regulator [Mycobacterium sp. SMC-19]|uniref:helix-turn-helix transcriptional regulator n=1 Tax=Mycobacterium sp. SMC-19 TaxID=3381630 RepID=UPI003875D799
MGSKKWSDSSFGKRVQGERASRGWSQAEMAKMLSDNGINPMHPTTVAKIEAGQRSVRINEALGIAELFETSIDSMVGHEPGTRNSELQYALRILRDTARQSSHQVFTALETLREQLEELPRELDGANALHNLGHHVWSTNLHLANQALLLLTELSEALLRKEQGRPSISDDGLLELRVENLMDMEMEAYKNAAQP